MYTDTKKISKLQNFWIRISCLGCLPLSISIFLINEDHRSPKPAMYLFHRIQLRYTFGSLSQRSKQYQLGYLCNSDYFTINAFLYAFHIVDKLRYKLTGWSTVELNLENERFNVECSRCRENYKFGNFSLSFGRLRRIISTKVRAARAARLFFLIQPIRSLFFWHGLRRCRRLCLSLQGTTTMTATLTSVIYVLWSLKSYDGKENVKLKWNFVLG